VPQADLLKRGEDRMCRFISGLRSWPDDWAQVPNGPLLGSMSSGPLAWLNSLCQLEGERRREQHEECQSPRARAWR
jgi:hypothetical protein